MNKLQAPFSYFGGKSAISGTIWQILGQPKHYLEPFFGSGAVLLSRPNYDPKRHIETICDADGFIANVWRSLQFNPDEVAKWCDWPVNHADLMARKKALLANEEFLLRNLVNDDKYYDPIMAGYWIWSASCWIATGLTRPNAIPTLLSGNGVHKRSIILSKTDKSMDVRGPYNINLYTWFRQLSERLRHVQVVCGDWTRICGGNWQDSKGTCGIFFDPPYTFTSGVYRHGNPTIAQDVNKWCLERGGKKTYKIILAGLTNEHINLLDYGWTTISWKAQGGWSNLGGK